MPAFPHWFEADPAILEHEQREYERHGLNLVLDQELLTTPQVVAFKGTVKVTGRAKHRTKNKNGIESSQSW